MFRHRGGWRRTSRRTVEAVRKAAGSVEVAQEAALEDCPGPVDSRAGGARETDKIAGEGEAIRDKAARGVVDWIVAAPSTYKGWLLEVCQRLYL